MTKGFDAAIQNSRPVHLLQMDITVLQQLLLQHYRLTKTLCTNTSLLLYCIALILEFLFDSIFFSFSTFFFCFSFLFFFSFALIIGQLQHITLIYRHWCIMTQHLTFIFLKLCAHDLIPFLLALPQYILSTPKLSFISYPKSLVEIWHNLGLPKSNFSIRLFLAY